MPREVFEHMSLIISDWVCPPGSPGDMVCVDECNIQPFNYDDGDCCLDIRVCSYCYDCFCHKTGIGREDFSELQYVNLMGDLICSDLCNVPELEYDGGDCCNPNADFSYCEDCICH